MAGSGPRPAAEWRVRGSYFEGCNCEAICPCRSVGGRPGGPSSFGECFGALSWHIHDGHADGVDLSGLRVVMSIRYLDRVRPSTPWEVVLYVDRNAGQDQQAALADRAILIHTDTVGFTKPCHLFRREIRRNRVDDLEFLFYFCVDADHALISRVQRLRLYDIQSGGQSALSIIR